MTAAMTYIILAMLALFAIFCFIVTPEDNSKLLHLMVFIIAVFLAFAFISY